MRTPESKPEGQFLQPQTWGYQARDLLELSSPKLSRLARKTPLRRFLNLLLFASQGY
jgi:hypothetical protein